MIIVLLFFIILNCCTCESTKSFPVTTLINAKWKQTPLYLEISEYLADESPSLFWDFITDLSKLDKPLNKYGTESQQYNIAIKTVGPRLSALQLPLLKLVVAMHSLTPRIQTHFKLAIEALEGVRCKENTFVLVNTNIICSLSELKKILENCSGNQKEEVDNFFSFDHVYPGSENNTNTFILYADIGSEEFIDFHTVLVNAAILGDIRYILRHFIYQVSGKLVRLSGYGVELHLKSTEYKNQDDAPIFTNNSLTESSNADSEVKGFDFKILKVRFPSLIRSLDQLRQNLMQINEEIAQLKAWEFQDLGLQATAAIAEIQGDEALHILQYTVHNFPMLARTLLGHKVMDDMRNEIKYNTESFAKNLNIAPPDGAIFINGLFFDADTMDLISLIETLRSEVRVLENLHINNVRGALASALMTLDLSNSNNQDFAIDIRDTAIQWINDIEKDAHYRRWPGSVMDLLRPTFPGMLRNIRKNVFHLLLVVDPLQPLSRSIIKLSESFVIHQAPIRLGLVFDERLVHENNKLDYIALICAYNYVVQKKDTRAALSFLTDIYANIGESEVVHRSHVRRQLKIIFDGLSNNKVDDILDEDGDYDYGRQLAADFIERLGFSPDGKPRALLNGVLMSCNAITTDNEFEENIFSEIIQQTSVLQKSVYRGDLTDNDVIIDYLMNQPHVMPRLNQRILANEEVKFLDINGKPSQNLNNVNLLNKLSNRDMTATLLANLKYFSGKNSMEIFGSVKLHFLTLWIFCDLSKLHGRALLENALKYTKTSKSVRVAFIPNTEQNNLSIKEDLNRLVWAAMHTFSPAEAMDLVLNWLTSAENEFSIPPLLNDIMGSTDLHIKMLRVYAQRALGLPTSQRLIIANGKLIGPLNPIERFNTEDFGLIERFNTLQYGDKIRNVLETATGDIPADFDSDTLLKLYSSLVPRQSKTRFKLPSDVKSTYSVVRLEPKYLDQPHFDIIAVVDPTARSAQKLTSTLILLRNILNCQIQLFLIPLPQHSDMPIKNFYRFVIEHEVQFSTNGELSEGPYAKFSGLPTNPLLTQHLQVPENWLVEAVRSVYDLDNIRLSDIGGPVHSEFELEFLLLEGHCFDSITGSPPRGLQLVLGTKTQSSLVDTIVMANLGYFQLKANPGALFLRLREGKSSELYDIITADGPNTIHNQEGTQVVISSLRSHVIKLRVSKKPGKQNDELLSDEESKSQTGIWNSIANSFGSGIAGDDEGIDTINIFSVASGHLYERLLRIMMVSLLKHTKSPVKFWFLKNYLSPQFTDFLPYMAREYNFHYELVQYKWPRWLHQQTEKQRTIWGYKILFLDVLFPLNVRKIIFVDADAIVRADIKQLYDMDLGGAPYAYTPFCDSRKEMEGFRFWKQGYWRSHLMGRRYHISALYVVDLKRFRKIAAGDRLRGQYQALSQDPNSLANLDQDLPNNMIHQVAIKSLPEEWLWCQTWCSDDSFKRAKVIDLCNNPMTKEGKLNAAQRIVPEWKDYDSEIKTLISRIEDHDNISEYDSQLSKLTKIKNIPQHNEL